MLSLVKCLTDIANRLNNLPPVGSVLAFADSTNPNTIFKNQTWVRFAQGQTLVGVNESDSTFSTVGITGGEKTHTLSASEMPAHYHNPYYSDYYFHSSSDAIGADTGGGISGNGYKYPRSAESSSWDRDKRTGVSGGSKAHNNLQPYITVYYWKRTA